MFSKDLTKKIEETLEASARKYFEKELVSQAYPKDAEVFLQISRDSKHGDLTSNVAMRLASPAKRAPGEIAESIASIFRDDSKKISISEFVSCEVKGGFINFRFSEKYYHRILSDIRKLRSMYGNSDEGRGKKVNLEYVSANPTGPLTIAHGRQAAIGDALSRILKFSGYSVTNEYYLNDIGRQIKMLGESVAVRYHNLFGENLSLPEDGYVGEYIIDIAREIKGKKGSSLLAKSPQNDEFFRVYAVEYMMRLIYKDLADFRVKFDVWTSQRAMEERKSVEAALARLQKNGHIYEQEGAKWFASKAYGDDKDRVVVKSDGSYTYLAPDIAYHADKYHRSFDILIDLLGPDHHGYIKRMKAAVQAMGHDEKSLNILIVQLVTLLRNGEAVSMSTRRGEFLSLRELIDEIGTDVTRFFFLSRRLDSHLDFDIELAKKESQENPVFYIQYAHARICSIKKFARAKALGLFFKKLNLDRLTAAREKELMRKLAEFPVAVKASAEALDPNRVIVYLNELARDFHAFYTECRVVSEDLELSKARLYMVECVRTVLASGLGLLNITFPEKM